jgi:uncharacterized protein YfcZ (UPF0381/DUF406 family)
VSPPAPGHSSLETMTHEYCNPSEGIYQHYACAKNGKVLLCNDSDGEYEQVFGNREELQRFVDHLMAVADEAWNEYCKASLDLSNQDAIAAPAGSLLIGGELPSPSITLHTKDVDEIARFTEDGFYYKGEFIDDAGEVHRLLKEVLGMMKAEQSQ